MAVKKCVKVGKKKVEKIKEYFVEHARKNLYIAINSNKQQQNVSEIKLHN